MGGAPPQASLYRINRRIRVPEIRVIGADGQQLGVLPTADALTLATEAGLDLVEISPQAVPPVCRIMDFGKFKFDETKKTRQAKRRQTVITIKEIKLRPKTGTHDYDFKLAHIRRFLQEGDKVRVIVQFRGREIVHPQTGRTMLERVVKDTTDIGQCDQMPAMEGRRMMMVVAPNAATNARAHQQPPAPPKRSEPPPRPAEATGDASPPETSGSS
jgi:translation initiation factor IF-3